MDFEYSDRTKELQEKLLKFMDEVIYPAESVYEEQMNAAKDRWQLPPVLCQVRPRRPPTLTAAIRLTHQVGAAA